MYPYMCPSLLLCIEHSYCAISPISVCGCARVRVGVHVRFDNACTLHRVGADCFVYMCVYIYVHVCTYVNMRVYVRTSCADTCAAGGFKERETERQRERDRERVLNTYTYMHIYAHIHKHTHICICR